MFNLSWLTCALAFVALPATAAPLNPLSLTDLKADLAQVRAANYPELSGFKIHLEGFESDHDFFKSSTQIFTVSEKPRDRVYLVLFNNQVLRDPPTREAIRAILAHELKHIVDYTHMTTWETAEFAVQYGLFPVAHYERATDLHALELGYAEGLKQYREWLYARVDLKTLALKKRNYYTPEQIDRWTETGQTSP